MNKRAVILVHGRGASPRNIIGLRDELAVPDFDWYTPEAPGNTWYPYSFLAPIEQNEPKLSASLAQLGQQVDQLVAAGIPRDRIVLAGFSQGACLATEYIARNAARYGGLIAFTGGLIGPPGTGFEYSGSLAGTPAFLGAGDPDPHVPWSRVQESANVLESMGADVVSRRYPGLPHTINDDELAEARKVLERVG